GDAAVHPDGPAGGVAAGACHGTAGRHPGRRAYQRRRAVRGDVAGAGVAQPRGVKSKELYPAVFSRHAEAYKARLDEIMARGEARGRLRMLEGSGAAPGMTVLDLACGPGNIKRLLAQRARHGGPRA